MKSPRNNTAFDLTKDLKDLVDDTESKQEKPIELEVEISIQDKEPETPQQSYLEKTAEKSPAEIGGYRALLKTPEQSTAMNRKGSYTMRPSTFRTQTSKVAAAHPTPNRMTQLQNYTSNS